MIYCFHCISPDHPAEQSRNFDVTFHSVGDKVINQYKCPTCGATAKRDFSQEIPTQSVIGATPISHSTSTKGSLAKELEFVAGRFRRNPDGTIDKNHRPFRDTGEMNKFMNGQNDLGSPSLDDNGRVRRRKDGSIIRNGAKLFKYGPNSAPSRTDVRTARPRVPNAWTNEGAGSGHRGSVNPRQLRPSE
jgi:hypothetical protein